VGIRSGELRDTHYTLAVSVDGTLVIRFPVLLRPGEEWQGAVEAPGDADRRIDVTLYAKDSPVRSVYVNVAQRESSTLAAVSRP
jgi:hypothetical protein